MTAYFAALQHSKTRANLKLSNVLKNNNVFYIMAFLLTNLISKSKPPYRYDKKVIEVDRFRVAFQLRVML